MEDRKEPRVKKLFPDSSMSRSNQSRWFRKSRQVIGLDVRAMAEEIGVSMRTINAWENENNSNLPSREKLFHYLMLLSGDRGLTEPSKLLGGSADPEKAGDRHSDKNLSRFFSKLNRNNRTVVNVLTRTLYFIQKRKR